MISKGLSPIFCGLFLATASLNTQAQLIWTVGLDDNGWPLGEAGGAEASFVQENGAINALPGSPESTTSPLGADNDYYFAGVFTTVIAGNGEYEPIGEVLADEIAAERAFAGGDLDLRYHFNLPATLQPTNLLTVTFDAFNLDTGGADPRFGVEVYVNGVKVQSEILIRGPQIGIGYTTPQFTIESVNAGVGPGFDNIVSLRGISYNSDGGGNWMGIDYVQLDQATVAIPPPVFPWAVGLDDNAWPTGTGGGTNANFVVESGTVNALPGSATGAGDNDYYFGGSFITVVTGNGTYEPVGIVSANEEATERGFSGADNELRYHFNLPNSLKPTDLMSVTFDALNLDTSGADPRYGVEIYFNGVRVQPEILIRAAQLDTNFTSPQFTLASVNAQVGAGYDNILSFRGISHSADGGGTRLGIDFVQLNSVAQPIPPPILPWSVGLNDNAQPAGNGGGANTTFVQEDGVINPLPGSPISTEVALGADNDYYFAGVYTTIIPGNGNYVPVGPVPVNEEAAERAFAAADNDLRYHFNLPANLKPTDQLTVAFDALSLQDDQADPRYGIEVYFNNVKVLPETDIRVENLGTIYNTPAFTLASVNAQVGPGFDNIVSLRGINHNADGGGNWMGFDFIQLSPVLAAPFPWSVGQDDNAQPVTRVGGGPNANFVQENGSINALPGNPANAVANGQSDNDYYFAGVYTNVIASVVAEYGEYEPVGVVLSNEESAERAFAAADNDLRYHFNLPASLLPTDQLLVTFDAISLDTGGADPRYGIEVWVNGVMVQEQIEIHPPDLDVDFRTPAFTLASVNAQVGPGADNIVSLKGINYNADGGGNWMGIDYVQLDPVPKPVFPWAAGLNDDSWPTGTGGGPNANFVAENGVINELPGTPFSRAVNGQADNDYYFAGVYTNVIAGNGDYVPVGIVPRNEEAAERAFAAADNELRYHFNLPSTLQPTNLLAVTFDALNLQDDQADPRYGIEVYFNGVLVQPQIVIRTNQLGVASTTTPFTLASVNAQVGPGADNIVTLKGTNFNEDGGGNWMGIDYVQLNPGDVVTTPLRFTSSVVAAGKVTLVWTGTGVLESSPVVSGGTWTAITPAPNGTYTEAIVANENRFYRLRP